MTRRWRRIWHELVGHPREHVRWGSAIEGARCRCGARWTLADYHI